MSLKSVENAGKRAFGATLSHPKALTQVIGCDFVAPTDTFGCDKVAPEFKVLYKLRSCSVFILSEPNTQKTYSLSAISLLQFLRPPLHSEPRRRHHSDRHHYHSSQPPTATALSLSLRPPPLLSLGPLLPRARLDLNRPASLFARPVEASAKKSGRESLRYHSCFYHKHNSCFHVSSIILATNVFEC